MLSGPVRPDGDDGNIVPENGIGTRSDGPSRVQQRLDRHLTHIRNQKTRLDRRIATLNQYMAIMDANIRSIAHNSPWVEPDIRIMLRCLNSCSRYVHPDVHVRDSCRLCAAIADMKNSIDFDDNTDNDDYID